MGQRLIEVFVPAGQGWTVQELLGDVPNLAAWRVDSGDQTLTRVLVEEKHAEAVLNRLDERFEHVEDFHVIVLAVEAILPRPGPEDSTKGQDETGPPSTATEQEGTLRISIQELRADVVDMCQLDRNFLSLVVLASIVAAIGLILDNVAIIIGSMVIAPLIGPSVALSLASTLGDGRMARQALKTNLAGLSASLVLPLVIGLIYHVDPSIDQIAIRTQASLWDVGLGLAVGSAGVLSVTTGVSTALVGVMVAVALVPPLVVVGLLIGSGHYELALGAAKLLATYVIAINLSGVVTFVARGVRPHRYWEEEKARRATVFAIVLWVLLLAALAAAIVLAPT